jgi:hypothetical protein
VVGGGVKDVTVAEDSLLEVDLAFADPDGGPLIYTVDGPAWLVLAGDVLTARPVTPRSARTRSR